MKNFYSDDFPEFFLKPENLHAKSNLLLTYPLGLAAANGDVDAVKELVKLGVNLNCRGDLNSTPLHEAASGGHAEVVRILLENGANPNLKNDINQLPLDLAKIKNHEAVINEIRDWAPLEKSISKEDLIEKYVSLGLLDDDHQSIHSANSEGEYPLHIAVSRNSSSEVISILTEGANPNQKTDDAWEMTALHLAVGQGRFSIMKTLIDCGADVFLKNGFGYSALDLAMMIGEKEQIFYIYEASKR